MAAKANNKQRRAKPPVSGHQPAPEEPEASAKSAPAADPAPAPPAGPHPFPVVGIGASAGGLSALKKFFAATPSRTGMAFVVVSHLDPTQKSLLVELLSKQTDLPIHEAADGVALEPDHVYVIPPNRYLALQQGKLHLTLPDEPRGLQLAIDFFLRSLAADQGERAIGIVLSGTGNHGTAGLKEIKLAGGVLLAQQPDTAEFDQMPRSAIASGVVDFVLPPEEMPRAIVEFVKRFYVAHPAETPAEEERRLLEPVLTLLRGQTKADFRYYRKNMLLRRIYRRMGLRRIDRLADYVQLLHDNAAETTALFKDMLIGVTSYFREPESYLALERQVIPELVERASDDRPVRVWVPGCATGEEAYSLAILLLEGFAAAKKTPSIQVFATDIDDDSLNVARQGIYPDSIAADLSSRRLQRFFTKTDEHHYQVNKPLRESVLLAAQNLIGDAPYSKLDLVSCRNLLIYLEAEMQQKVIPLFHFVLNERGFLVLGQSETVGRNGDLFEPVSKKWRIFRRLGGTRRELVDIPINFSSRPRGGALQPSPAARPAADANHLMQKLLLDDYAPAAVLVNRKFEILSQQGPLVNYLQFPSGEPTKALLALLRPGLRVKIRAAVARAIRERQTVVDETALVQRDGHYVACTITVRLVSGAPEDEGLLLIALRDRVGQASGLTAGLSGQMPDLQDEEIAVVRQLEDELRTTREELQGTIDELETSHAELRTSHEEVMSMNEELQSANEELETSKEELQSLNEELSTVNSQLQAKVSELERANSDMANLLASTDLAVVFLDAELRIVWFTPVATQLLSLRRTDIRRPLRDLAPKIADPALWTDCQRVLEGHRTEAKEVWSQADSRPLAAEQVGQASGLTVRPHAHASGQRPDLPSPETGLEHRRCYLRQIYPYRTGEGHVEGIVITLLDITGRIAREAEARRLATVLHDSNDAVLMHDLTGQITSWNRGAERNYGYAEGEALRMNVVDLLPPARREAAVARLAGFRRGEPLPTGSFEVQRLTQDGHTLEVWVTATPFTDETGQSVAIGTTERDITEQKKQLRDLEALKQSLEEQVVARTREARQQTARLQAIVDSAADGIITIGEDGLIDTFNRAAERMFGYPAAEVIGRNVKLIMASPYREEHEGYINRYLRTGQARIIGTVREVVGRRKDDSEFPLELSVSELHDGAQRLFTGLLHDVSERKELQRDVLQASEEEQRRIGQDLHDSTQQELSGLGMIAQGLFESLQGKSAPEAKSAARLSQGIGRALENVRALARGLVPAEVRVHGLRSALAELARNTAELHQLDCTYVGDDSFIVDDANIATHLYRIAQEALTNALKHARARHIQLALSHDDGLITLQIQDDGRGIEEPPEGAGIGLKVMFYRAGLIGAALRIVRLDEGGTLVLCKVPQK